MMIAFASEENRGLDSMLAYHFGRCPNYVFVEIKGNRTGNVRTLKNPFLEGHGPGTVPQFIAEQNADTIIAGGMGPRAIDWFRELGVTPITTVPRKIDDILSDFLRGKLEGAESCKDHDH